MQNQPTGYPKVFWTLVRASVIVEDGKEVVDPAHEVLLGGTFDAIVAEKMAAVLQDNNNPPITMIRSDVSVLPTKILEVLEPASSQEKSIIDDIIEETQKQNG